MAKKKRDITLSSSITEDESKIIQELDEVIDESRASFIRRVVIREAVKTINKNKKES